MEALGAPGADSVLDLAREEAVRLGHDYIGTEHQLLAILRTDDPEVRAVLDRGGVTADEVREALGRTLPAGHPGRIRPGADLPLTSRANRVLRLAEEAWRAEGGASLRPIHFLRGFRREGKNVATLVLQELGVAH